MQGSQDQGRTCPIEDLLPCSHGVHNATKHGLCHQTRVQVPALRLLSGVTLSKSLNLSEPQFLHL